MKGLTVSSRRSDLKRWPFSVVPHDVATFPMITMIALSCCRVVDDKMRFTKKAFHAEVFMQAKDILIFAKFVIEKLKNKNRKVLLKYCFYALLMSVPQLPQFNLNSRK